MGTGQFGPDKYPQGQPRHASAAVALVFLDLRTVPSENTSA